MPTPLVLVSADHREFAERLWFCANVQYPEAVLSGAGAVPLILPALGERMDLDGLLDRVDGVLLTGSLSNVHPSHYGVTPTPGHEPYDMARDATTLPLARKAVDKGVPLFGICRGFQELNVALGGTLDTDIHTFDGRMNHLPHNATDPDIRYKIAHPIHVVRDSCIGRILEADEVDVNSVHRQGIATLSPRLIVEATAADGTIEAVRVADAKNFAVAVQWHPEYWVKSDGPSAKLFAAFGEAVRAHANRPAARQAAE